MIEIKILLTGNCGFVGKHVEKALKTSGHIVHGLDLPYDFTDETIVANVFNNIDYDIVIHVGAMAGLPKCYDDPAKAIEVNVQGTNLLLKYAGKNNCKFLYTSTWAVNGGLEHPYDISKKMAEELVSMYHNIYDVDTMILRLATMYGPGMRENGVIYNFIKKGINEPLVIEGNGKQYRQFLYVEDATKSFVKALEHWKSGSVYEIQGDEKVSVLDVAMNVYPDMKKIEFITKRRGDEKPFEISNYLAKTELKWKPIIKLKEGMEMLKIWIEKS